MEIGFRMYGESGYKDIYDITQLIIKEIINGTKWSLKNYDKVYFKHCYNSFCVLATNGMNRIMV